MTFSIENEAALQFLTEGLSDYERDAFMRAFFEFARGDDRSFPVQSAVLQLVMAKLLKKLPDLVSANVLQHRELVGRMAEAAAKMGSDTAKVSEVATQLAANEAALKNLIKTAVADIDVSELTKKFDNALLNSVAQSKEATAALVTAGEAATTQIASARKATLIWAIPIIFLSAAILSASIFVWQWTELKERNNQAMIRAIQSYGEAYTVLATAGMTLQTSQTQDGSTFIYVPQAKDAYKAADYHGCVIQLK